jgi:hypothetical protein
MAAIGQAVATELAPDSFSKTSPHFSSGSTVVMIKLVRSFWVEDCRGNSSLGDLGVVAFTRRMRKWDQQRLAKCNRGAPSVQCLFSMLSMLTMHCWHEKYYRRYTSAKPIKGAT